MMANKKKLIQKYKKFYSRIRNLAQNNEAFPELSDDVFEWAVSQKDWMGVPPKEYLTKKDMTNSDKGHIGIEIGEKETTLDLWFNSTRAVRRFVNILNSVSKDEREKFVSYLKKLDDKYKIRVLYTEKFFAASADWQVEKEIRCKDLTSGEVEELLSVIKRTLEKRDYRQKEIPKREVATVAVSIAEVHLDKNDEEGLREALGVLGNLLIITKNIKSSSEIKKTLKVLEKERVKWEEEVRRLEAEIEKDLLLVGIPGFPITKESVRRKRDTVNELKNKLIKKAETKV